MDIPSCKIFRFVSVEPAFTTPYVGWSRPTVGLLHSLLDWATSSSSKPFNTDKCKLTNVQSDVDCYSIQPQKITLVPLGRLENDNTCRLYRKIVRRK